MKHLQNISLDDVKQWYQKWYSPNNAILVIVGDVNAESALRQVQKYFGDIKSHPTPVRNDVTELRTLVTVTWNKIPMLRCQIYIWLGM